MRAGLCENDHNRIYNSRTLENDRYERFVFVKKGDELIFNRGYCVRILERVRQEVLNCIHFILARLLNCLSLRFCRIMTIY